MKSTSTRMTTPFPTLLLLLSILIATEAAFHHVFTGTGAIEVQLIAAKLAIRAGDTCSLVGPSDTSHVNSCRALMYGKKAAKEFILTSTTSGTTSLAFVTEGEDIAAALKMADYVHLVCDDKALGDSMVGSILESAPDVKHVALVSKMGGKFKGLEGVVKDICNKRDVPCSVLRTGVYKGGGPGEVYVGEDNKLRDDTAADADADVVAADEASDEKEAVEYGLSRFFYDTNFDLPDAMNTMAFDKYTLGVKITPGDQFKTPGKLWQQFSASSSFEPSDTDTGRIAAAQAMLAVVGRGEGVDVSLSTQKGTAPPSFEEWETMLAASGK